MALPFRVAPPESGAAGPAGPPEHVDLYSFAEWRLACRIAASRGFAKSDLLPRFLLYVCERTLLGHSAELTEQHLGTHIFNRAPDYDPAEDNIVRSYARTLRKRLEAYFQAEGCDEVLRLSIPRGGYTPVFTSVENVEAPVAPTSVLTSEKYTFSDARTAPETSSSPLPAPLSASLSAPPSARPSWSPWVFAAVGLLTGLLLAALAVVADRSLHTLSRTAAGEGSPAHVLWAELFTPARTTMIVPADSGLGILQNLTHQPATLEGYVNGTYLDHAELPAGLDQGSIDDLRRQHYTSFIDLNVASTLQRLPEAALGHVELRHTHDVNTDDLKRNNAVLIGSRHANPWVELYSKRLNFRMEYTTETNRSFITNADPRPGERLTYPNGNPTYAVVAFLPGLDGKGRVLLIQGLNMAGTQAAADTLGNAALIDPILRQAAGPNGSLRPFEYLVEAFSIGANAPEAHILATRVH